MQNQTCQIVETSTNKYGEQIQDSQTEVACRFREITQADQNNNMDSFIGVDAMLWVEPEVDIQEGTIVKIEDRTWRVIRLIKARAMTADVKFQKALLEKHTGVNQNDAS